MSEPDFIRVPEPDAIEPRSGLTGAELRELVRNRDVYAVPTRPGQERVLLISWRSLHHWIHCQDRLESYKRPRNYEQLLARYPNRHHRQADAGLQVVAGPFGAGEESSVEQVIAEQGHRQVELLYSRKSVWVAFRRRSLTK